MRGMLLASLLVGACGPQRIEITRLADGEWIVLDASTPGAVMMQMSGTARPRDRRIERDAPPIIRILGDSLETVTTRLLSVVAGTQTISVTRVEAPRSETLLATLGTPRLQRSPTQQDHYVFELDNSIWAFNATDTSANKLTHDEGFDSLSALQREGEVILYWASNPVWSADGKFVAFLTNRHGVRTRTASQGLRIIEMETRIEKDLINTIGTSVHTDGVFETEFVYSSSSAPGVFAVEPLTGATRKLGDGYVAGFHDGGRGVLLNDQGRLILVRAGGSKTVPAADSGFTYISRASFSPSGDRIAMFSTDERGRYALHVYDRAADTMLRVPLSGGPSYGPAWASDTDVIFAAAAPSQPLATFRAKIR